MKELNEYKTYTAIKRDMAKEGFNRIEGVDFRRKISNGSWWADYDRVIYLTTEKNLNCCAVNEFGDFHCQEEDDRKYWPYVIKAGLLYYKPKIVNCATIPRQGEEINEALCANGFNLRGQVQSNEGNYMVSLWDWWKPTKGKKKT